MGLDEKKKEKKKNVPDYNFLVSICTVRFRIAVIRSHTLGMKYFGVGFALD